MRMTKNMILFIGIDEKLGVLHRYAIVLNNSHDTVSSLLGSLDIALFLILMDY